MSLARFNVYAVFFLLTWTALPLNAHAYLDPTSGGYIVQVVAASVLGSLFAIKTYWNVIKHKFSTLFSKIG